MKLRCEVTRVETNGDMVAVTLQGHGQRDASWRRWGTQHIEVAATAKASRAFYLGRVVNLTVDPQ